MDEDFLSIYGLTATFGRHINYFCMHDLITTIGRGFVVK